MHRVSFSPRPWAIVEITSGSDERERTELIRAAYRSSRSGVVALALRGITRQTVDRALDSVVDMRDSHVRGVVYLDAERPTEDLLAAARAASLVVASSDDFRTELREWGIDSVRIEDGARALLASPKPH